MIHQISIHVISMHGLCLKCITLSCQRTFCQPSFPASVPIPPEKLKTPWNLWLCSTYTWPKRGTYQRGLLPLITFQGDATFFSFSHSCWSSARCRYLNFVDPVAANAIAGDNPQKRRWIDLFLDDNWGSAQGRNEILMDGVYIHIHAIRFYIVFNRLSKCNYRLYNIGCRMSYMDAINGYPNENSVSSNLTT